jgi:uncharacterized protein (DUF342 family)
MAKSFRYKCMNIDVRRMIGNREDLDEKWDTLVTYYKRQEKYLSQALKLIVKLRRNKMSDSTAIRDFYSLLRAAIEGTWMVGHLRLLINN